MVKSKMSFKFRKVFQKQMELRNPEFDPPGIGVELSLLTYMVVVAAVLGHRRGVRISN